MTELVRVADAEAVGTHAAERIAAGLRDALSATGVAHFGLSGGSTPRRAYELVAVQVDDWSSVHLWYGDERMVGPSDPDSTHLLVAESLLAAIASSGSPPPVEHRVHGESASAEEAAAEYAALMRDLVPLDDAGVPALDVNVLGIGEDGHTASLFPGFAQVGVVDAVCVAVHDSPKPPPDRVTLTVPVLRAARTTLVLASGAGKASSLGAALRGPDPAIPASLTFGDRTIVIADEAALAEAG
jgi:6-phosphogluconolactonase